MGVHVMWVLTYKDTDGEPRVTVIKQENVL